MVGNILNERMRFDIATLLPELSCNKLRYYEPIDGYAILCRSIIAKTSHTMCSARCFIFPELRDILVI